jgi:pilus assembly protein CpaF
MSLRDRLDTIRNEPLSVAVAAKGVMGIDKKQYADLKIHIHQTLLDQINLEAMEDLPPQRLKEELRNLVERLLEDENVVINDIERRNLVRDIQYEMLGLGPLEPLLVDPTISDILVNSYRQVYVERRGKLELTDVVFNDDAHLMKIIDKIVSRVGRRVD